METQNIPNLRLKFALLANACFSTLCAVPMIGYANQLASLTGIGEVESIRSMGFGLLLFAGFLFFLTRGKSSKLQPFMVWPVVFGDFFWVIASFAGLATGCSSLTTLGSWLVAEVAILVGLFGAAQAYFLIKRERVDIG